MNLCSHNHEEVAFEGHNCPFCATIEEHESTLSDKDSTISDLQSANDSLQTELDSIAHEHKKQLDALQEEINRMIRGKADGEV